MARLLWGCYSAADHLEPRAFVLICCCTTGWSYPSADDMARWEQRWDPERQARLLGILGGFAERVEWTDPPAATLLDTLICNKDHPCICS